MKALAFEYHVKAEPAAISCLSPHCGEPGVDEIKSGRFRAIFANIGDRALIDRRPERDTFERLQVTGCTPGFHPGEGQGQEEAAI